MPEPGHARGVNRPVRATAGTRRAPLDGPAPSSTINRILFVDDEPHVLAGLRRMFRLRNAGAWTAYYADGGAEALEVMATRPFHVVVSDFRMPGIDGAQFLYEVRRRYPQTVRLVLSGAAEERGLVQLAGLAHQFVSKGCDADLLTAALDLPLRLGLQLDKRMRAEVTGIGMLPSSRACVGDLLAALDSRPRGVEPVVEALQRDVGLTAKVLQLVNSAFFAPRARITSLEDAVVRLGMQTIRSVVFESDCAGGLDVADPGARDRIELLNRHALVTARLARQLAPPQHADDAFCAGLLHECGNLAVAAARPDVLMPSTCPHKGNARRAAAIETQKLAGAGAYLLSLWGFPPEVVGAVARHADPVDVRTGQRPDLASAVQIAHLFAESERLCACGRPGHPGPDDAWLEAAGILEEIRHWKAERALSAD